MNTPKRQMKMTPEQQAEHGAKMLAEFDRRCPVGTKVWYYTILPFGPVKETTVQKKAWLLKDNHPVCKLRGISGGVSIFHIFAIDESRRTSIQFAE